MAPQLDQTAKFQHFPFGKLLVFLVKSSTQSNRKLQRLEPKAFQEPTVRERERERERPNKMATSKSGQIQGSFAGS